MQPEVRSRALELLIGEKRDISEVRQILLEEGYGDVSRKDLLKLKRDTLEALRESYELEHSADFLLDSIKRVFVEFDDLYNKFKDLYVKLEAEGRTFEQLLTLKELRSMLNMALRRLGEYKEAIEKIKAKNVYISNTDIVMLVKQAQDKIFDDTEPILVDGKLILQKPTPELLDAYRRWYFVKKTRKIKASV